MQQHRTAITDDVTRRVQRIKDAGREADAAARRTRENTGGQR